jgi:hypothetical protein
MEPQNCNCRLFSVVPVYCDCAYVVYPVFPNFQFGNMHLIVFGMSQEVVAYASFQCICIGPLCHMVFLHA